MARVKVHELCRRPLAECGCPDDGEPGEDEAQDSGGGAA